MNGVVRFMALVKVSVVSSETLGNCLNDESNHRKSNPGTCHLNDNNSGARAWQTLQNDMCTQRVLRSAYAAAQSDKSIYLALDG